MAKHCFHKIKFYSKTCFHFQLQMIVSFTIIVLVILSFSCKSNIYIVFFLGLYKMDNNYKFLHTCSWMNFAELHEVAKKRYCHIVLQQSYGYPMRRRSIRKPFHYIHNIWGWREDKWWFFFTLDCSKTNIVRLQHNRHYVTSITFSHYNFTFKWLNHFLLFLQVTFRFP